MKKLWIKISAIAIVVVFLGIGFVSSNSMHIHPNIRNSLSGACSTNNQASSSDPSVHLYVNGNGYVVFSANYSVDGIINCNFDNDRTQNFTTNDVPTGTVFHLVSSPNSGYVFQRWSGSVNSTDNSIYFTVNQNIKEEAIYQKLPYSVTFTESGLPSGDSWWVNFNGQNITSSSSSITFSVSDGTYSYKVQSMGTYGVNYDPDLSSGTVTVDGYNETTDVAYFPEYYLNVITSPSSYGTVSPSSGWYSLGESLYLLASPNSGYGFSSWKGTGSGSYTGTSDSATITMNGPINETATFYIAHYSVTFTESGLLSGTWYVNLSNGMKSGAITGSSYSFELTYGTYSYSIATNNKIYHADGGSLNVNGLISSNDISVSFSKELYKVTFMESGLPSGTSWKLVFNDHTYSLTNTSYSFQLTNGTYSYSIATNNKIYHADGGSLTINGKSMQENISFSKVVYSVKFTESGLPSGSTWYVNGSMTEHTLSGSTISFLLSNGTYSFSVTNTTMYYATTTHFSITVNGKNITETVTYNHYSYIKGTISPNNANVTINGKIIHLSSTGSFNMTVTAGSYDLIISEKGYRTYYDNFTMTNGITNTIDQNLTKLTTPMSSMELYEIIGTVVGIGALASAAVFYIRKK